MLVSFEHSIPKIKLAEPIDLKTIFSFDPITHMREKHLEGVVIEPVPLVLADDSLLIASWARVDALQHWLTSLP